MAKQSPKSVSIMPVILVASSVTILSLFVSQRLYQVQPEPYMDEEFHVRQTKTYLAGNWSVWDEKITTPPGTYILFLAYYHVFLQWFLPNSQSLTLLHFRSFNSLICGLNFFLIYAISRRVRGPRSHLLFSLVLVTNPVLFFFSSMYYTDQSALLFVLLSIYLAIRDCYLPSAIASAVGVCVRQTNIVWLLASCSWLMSVRFSRSLFGSPHLKFPQSVWFRRLFSRLQLNPGSIIWLKLQSVFACWSHVLVGLLFILFVFWNGGVVLGDRSAHVAVVHVPQLWYFVIFLTLCSPSGFLSFWSQILRLKNSAVHYFSHLILLAITIILIAFSLYYFRFVHPYLLADNRHFVFYIWRRIIDRSAHTYYGLSVLYAFCSIYSFRRLFSSNSVTLPHLAIRVHIMISTCLVLIPAGLIEPRYFLIPYVCWRLFACPIYDRLPHLFTELLLNAIVHFASVYVFIKLPFHWSSSPDVVQHFMW